MVKTLVSHGANVNAADGDGEYAASLHQPVKISQLIVTLPSTPLHLAVMRNVIYEIVRVLIENGGNLDTHNSAGRTPLHQHFNPMMRHTLLVFEGLIELYSQGHDGMTIVHYYSASKTTRPEDLYRLIGKNLSSLAVKDHLGRSALTFAVMRGNTAVISWMLGLGVYSNSNLMNLTDVPLLHYAVYSKRTETLDILYEHFQNIYVKDHRGRSILHYAAWQDNEAALQKVVELGGIEMLFQVDSSGESPLTYAARVEADSFLSCAQTLAGERSLSAMPVPAILKGLQPTRRIVPRSMTYQLGSLLKQAGNIDAITLFVILAAVFISKV